MKIIQYPLPDISKMEVTQIRESIPALQSGLKVNNISDFKVNDWIVIEKPGNEYAEMDKIINVVSTIQSLDISSALTFAHQEGTCVRKTPFNQSRLYRSTDNVNYTLIDTKDLDWQDKYGLITFIDNNGDDSYYYKVEYWNETTNSGIMSSPIHTLSNTGFLTVEEFKRETGIEGNDEVIATALKYGAENIKRNLYVEYHSEFITPNTTFNTYYGQDGYKNLQYADGDLNGVIDKNDFVAYEESQDGTRTYVTSDIVAIDVDRQRITFGSTHPTGSNKLIIEFFLTFRKITSMQTKLRRLNMLYAVNYLFQNIPFSRLQKGIGGWSINGVSVNYEAGMIRDVISDNKKEINILLKEFARLYTVFTPIQKPRYKGLGWFKSTLHWSSDNVPVNP